MLSPTTVFAEKVLARFAQLITDEVFLLIQNDRGLMHEYLRLVQSEGLDTVNQWIGRSVKARFQLENLPERQGAPRSTLIQSHQMFK